MIWAKTICVAALVVLAAYALSFFARAEPPPIHYGLKSKQFGELWLPQEPGAHPAVILIHGGGWQSHAELAYVRPFAAALASAGFAVWSIEYRGIGDDGGGFPGTFLDVGAAADHLREIAKTRPIDVSNVIAVGHSAGGQLALWLAGRPRLPQSSPLRAANPQPIRGVVDLAGPADFRAWLEVARPYDRATVETLIGAQARGFDTALKDTSPAELLPLGAPQTLVFGALDEIVPPGQAELYQAAAGRKGERVEVVVVAEAQHPDFTMPDKPAMAQSLRAVESVLRQARQQPRTDAQTK